MTLDCTDAEYANTSATAPLRILSGSKFYLENAIISTMTQHCISATTSQMYIALKHLLLAVLPMLFYLQVILLQRYTGVRMKVAKDCNPAMVAERTLLIAPIFHIRMAIMAWFM